MESSGWLGWLVGVSLAANAVLGVLAFNHYEWIQIVEADSDHAVSEADSLSEEVSAVEDRLDDLEDEPAIDPTVLARALREMETQINGLRSDYENLSDAVLAPSFGVFNTIDAANIAKPYFCRVDDPVYWDARGISC